MRVVHANIRRQEIEGLVVEFGSKRTAAPVGGRANRALERLLAKRLGVPNSAVSVVVGHTGRRKVVEVEGVGEAEARRRFEDGAP